MTKDTYTITGADYAEILEQVGVAVISINDKGLIVYVNAAAVKLFGHSAAQMLGQNVSRLMPEHHAVRHDGYLQHHLRTGERRIIGQGRRTEGLKADGTVFPIHLAVSRHELDGKLQFTGIVHDLTEQERSRGEALRFGRIINESNNEIYVFDASSLNFTLVNRGALSNLGYELHEMLEMTPLDVKTRFTEKSFRHLIAPLLNGEAERISFNCDHLRKDGSYYDTDVTLHLSLAISPPQIVSIIVDCTERNRMLEAVQQSQKMESIGHLTGGIAHDFNNLLTVMTGNLELLEMSIDDENELELIAEARAAANRGAKLTASLLAFARRSTLTPERVNLNDVVLNLSDLLIRSVGEHIAFSTILSPNVWPVFVDQSQVDSALLNLTINARDAMPDGGTLTIKTSNRSVSPSEAEHLHVAPGNYAQLSVFDTGTGIDPDHLQRIFEPFFTTKLKSQGQGLGLSMVFGFARQSGGCLSVSSQLGEGSVFELLLPRNWSDQGSMPEEASDQAQSAEFAGACVLLVEDDDSVRKVTSTRLQHMGLQTIEASNGAEALTLFYDNPQIELLFTDMVMPGPLSGWDLAQKILEIKPALPVILSSGYSEQLQRVELQQLDNISILSKPYKLEMLESIVSGALRSAY